MVIGQGAAGGAIVPPRCYGRRGERDFDREGFDWDAMSSNFSAQSGSDSRLSPASESARQMLRERCMSSAKSCERCDKCARVGNPDERAGEPGWRAVALFVGYVALYVALDRLSFIEPLHGIGITPWNPSTGLMLTLLIIKGPRWSPVVLAAELLSQATLPLAHIPPAPVFVAALVVTLGYASAAAILRQVGFEASLRRTSDVVQLLVVTIISSCLVACGFVATYAAAGVVPWTGFADAVFQFWIGDAIGIVVFAPPLLILTRPMECAEPPDRDRHWLQLVEIAAQGASIVAALAAVFLRVGGDHPLGLFYLLFPPVIWVATRRGLAATSWALLAI